MNRIAAKLSIPSGEILLENAMQSLDIAGHDAVALAQFMIIRVVDDAVLDAIEDHL